MANFRCCFGCMTLRNGVRIISVSDMLLKTIFAIAILKSSEHLYQNTSKFNYYDSEYRHILMLFDIHIFILIAILFIFNYNHWNLKNATYAHNPQIIKQWLVTNSIIFVIYLLGVVLIEIKYSTNNHGRIISKNIILIIIEVYKLYVVKCFYNEEVEFLATSAGNVALPTIQCAPIVSITSQNVLPLHPVQFGPYVVQQGLHPVAQAPYPQPTYHYESQQPFVQSHPVVPRSDQRAPQEYPPSYSTISNAHGGFSAKP